MKFLCFFLIFSIFFISCGDEEPFKTKLTLLNSSNSTYDRLYIAIGDNQVSQDKNYLSEPLESGKNTSLNFKCENGYQLYICSDTDGFPYECSQNGASECCDELILKLRDNGTDVECKNEETISK